jgi:hypothetical protein
LSFCFVSGDTFGPLCIYSVVCVVYSSIYFVLVLT